jgi:hypothetical protein
MKPTWYETTRARILAGTLTEAELRILRLRIRRGLNQPYHPRESYKPCTAQQAHTLLELVEDHHPRVSDTQARKGADWLYRLAFRKDGGRRTTPAARQFTDADLQVIREQREVPCFSLIGFDEQSRESDGYFVGLAPIYRAHGAHTGFTYVAAAWQSGGAFAVTQHAMVQP